MIPTRIFFKFIAETAGDYSKGQLYVYKQGETKSDAGTWMPIDMTLDNMINVQAKALELEFYNVYPP